MARTDRLETCECQSGSPTSTVDPTPSTPASSEPGASTSPVPTESLAVNNLVIIHSSDPAVLEGEGYEAITSVTGRLYIFNNAAMSTLGAAFQSLVHVGHKVQIEGNPNLISFGTSFQSLLSIGSTRFTGCNLLIRNNVNLTSLGTAFESLVTIGGALYSGHYLTIDNNPRLASFGTSFRSLTRLTGPIVIRNNNAGLTDFENFRNLTCHGGVYQGNPSAETKAYYCQGCPDWLVNLPTCD